LDSKLTNGQNNLESLPRALYNKHHLLYPKHIWQKAGKDALYLRGEFIVRLPITVHRELHERIDPLINDAYCWCLPTRSTLSSIAMLYELHEYELKALDVIDRLHWLESWLEPCFSNSWLRRLIEQEIDFLSEYVEEIR
jgi:hypothetical protein